MKPTLSEETEKRFNEQFDNLHDVESWSDERCCDGQYMFCDCKKRVKQFIDQVEAAAEERGRLKGAAEERERVKGIVKHVCFGAVILCEPDCDPVTHARHDGSWKTYWKIEHDLLESLNNPLNSERNV